MIKFFKNAIAVNIKIKRKGAGAEHDLATSSLPCMHSTYRAMESFIIKLNINNSSCSIQTYAGFINSR